MCVCECVCKVCGGGWQWLVGVSLHTILPFYPIAIARRTSNKIHSQIKAHYKSGVVPEIKTKSFSLWVCSIHKFLIASVFPFSYVWARVFFFLLLYFSLCAEYVCTDYIYILYPLTYYIHKLYCASFYPFCGDFFFLSSATITTPLLLLLVFVLFHDDPFCFAILSHSMCLWPCMCVCVYFFWVHMRFIFSKWQHSACVCVSVCTESNAWFP